MVTAGRLKYLDREVKRLRKAIREAEAWLPKHPDALLPTHPFTAQRLTKAREVLCRAVRMNP